MKDVKIEGLVYAVIKERAEDNMQCCGCAFRKIKNCVAIERPACSSHKRHDGVGVIFVEKHP